MLPNDGAMSRGRTTIALVLALVAEIPAVPSAQASTFYRIRTSSPAYTGYLADSKAKHPQSLPADITAHALVTIQNPVDPAAHWRLSGAPISYRGSGASASSTGRPDCASAPTRSSTRGSSRRFGPAGRGTRTNGRF